MKSLGSILTSIVDSVIAPLKKIDPAAAKNKPIPSAGPKLKFLDI